MNIKQARQESRQVIAQFYKLATLATEKESRKTSHEKTDENLMLGEEGVKGYAFIINM